MCTLIARWTSDQDWTVEPPQSVFWGDLRPATQQDYVAHLDDTYELVVYPDGSLERRIYPWIVADVRYDGYSCRWWVVPREGEPLSLDLSDRDAPDDELMAELHQLPMIYRSMIHR